MVARLKLKEIDGRAPPGVNRLSQPQSLRLMQHLSREVWWSNALAFANKSCLVMRIYSVATHLICGEFLMLQVPPACQKTAAWSQS